MMAKMFYSLEEAAEKLGKSEEEVREMAKSGQLQEFRDRDKLMFKVEQIDLLSGGDDEDDEEIQIPLEDSGGASGSGLALADSELGMSDSREGTGISVFDTDHGKEDEESDQTHVGDTVEDDDISLESVGSGSGLLDLTKESDDTAVGAELIEDALNSEDSSMDIPANASGLFEATPDDSQAGASEFGSPQPVAMAVEAYDGSGSGLGVGLLVGALVALVCLAFIGMVGATGVTPQLAISMADNIWIWVGAIAGIAVVAGGLGWFIGRASE